MKKRFLLFLVGITLPLIGMAWKGNTTIDGVNYYLQYYPTDKEYWAEVIDGTPVGDIVIPDSIYYEGSLWDNNVGEGLGVAHKFAVVRIRANAFKDCSFLNSMKVSNELLEIGDSAFKRCANLESIQGGAKLIRIGRSAFEGCKRLKTSEVGNLLTKLIGRAYYGCTSLTKITLSNYLGGKEHFSGCEKLKDIYVNFKIPFLLDDGHFDSFSDDVDYIYKNARLHVPKGSVERYQKEDTWKKFITITGDIERSSGSYIEFIDSKTEALCLLNWDTNHDGRFQKSEAASVETLGTVLKNQSDMSYI